MKKLKLILASFLTAFSVVFAPVTASAITAIPQCSGTAVGTGSASAICAASKTDNISGIIKNIVDILLYIVGAVSVIMLIYGGLRYATSAGVAANITTAKNTILYAIIGLVISVLAYAIVHFVISAVTTGKAT